MPLPSQNAPWPPVSWSPVFAKMAEWDAWYSNDVQRLLDVYAYNPPANPWWRVWNRARAGVAGSQKAQLHVPIASDLASVSAALLFGEPANVRVNQAHTAKPTGVSQKAEERLLEVLRYGGWDSRCVEAAESAAAMGGIYLYPAWDKEFLPYPVMASAQADQAVPTFRWGVLVHVIFSRVVEGDTQGREVYRHLEEHTVENGQAIIRHALYKGTGTSIGAQANLELFPSTERLEPLVVLPFKELDVEYVPNMRPNRLWRSSGLGVPDIQGSEGLLDSIDETYSSWMRDIRLAKARIFVPREYLVKQAGREAAFDLDQEVYVEMDMEPQIGGDTRAMMATQFNIRYLEHRSTARDLIEKVVSNAGYTVDTLGHATDNGSSVRTGAALRIIEHKTLLTLKRKSGFWRNALENVLAHLVQVDKEVFGSNIASIRPSVEMADSIIEEPIQLAQTAQALRAAEAASTESLVRMIHSDWPDDEVQAEVERISGEQAVETPPPPFGASAQGTPSRQGASTSPSGTPTA